MSRYGEYDGDGDQTITYEMWQWNAERALKGKRGQAALRDLREALLHLPEKRLIARALCTVGDERIPAERPVDPNDKWGFANYARNDLLALVEEQGSGVCAVGAYVWWQKVKAGASPEEAFAAIPTLADTESEMYDTAYAGKAAGLTYTLAWELAYTNDETFNGLTPEQRYERFMAWLDEHIA